MPPYGKEQEIDTFLDRVDGFVLTGGLDMDPRRQGLPLHRSVQPMPARREDHDRILVRTIMQRQAPVLAIGVGLHQLNVAGGGTLIQHLPEEMPRAMPHVDPSCSGPHRHAVLLKAGSRLEEIYGEGEIRVNSSHHQAVKAVGAPFRVAAAAPDGVIEALEAADPNWFCLAVQWHPESESASALDLQLFECFVQACTRQAQPLALAA
jgi:putative glutamine amidotransferase